MTAHFKPPWRTPRIVAIDCGDVALSPPAAQLRLSSRRTKRGCTDQQHKAELNNQGQTRWRLRQSKDTVRYYYVPLSDSVVDLINADLTVDQRDGEPSLNDQEWRKWFARVALPGFIALHARKKR